MKITQLEILKVPPSWVWLRIHTDAGITGLGEPYLENHADSVIAEVRRLYGPRPLWITEYGYQTDPPDGQFGVSWTKQARYLTQAFAVARRNPSISLMLWFLVRDEPNVAGWQSGLITTGGKKKPSFNAFRNLRH